MDDTRQTCPCRVCPSLSVILNILNDRSSCDSNTDLKSSLGGWPENLEIEKGAIDSVFDKCYFFVSLRAQTSCESWKSCKSPNIKVPSRIRRCPTHEYEVT